MFVNWILNHYKGTVFWWEAPISISTDRQFKQNCSIWDFENSYEIWDRKFCGIIGPVVFRYGASNAVTVSGERNQYMYYMSSFRTNWKYELCWIMVSTSRCRMSHIRRNNIFTCKEVSEAFNSKTVGGLLVWQIQQSRIWTAKLKMKCAASWVKLILQCEKTPLKISWKEPDPEAFTKSGQKTSFPCLTA